MFDQQGPDPDCPDCQGSGWIEIGSGWGAENAACSCHLPKGQKATDREVRKRGHEAFSHFASIALIMDDCLAAGVLIYCIKMSRTERDTLVRQRAKKRKRNALPGKEATILGVPVIVDDSINRPFIVVTEENKDR